jgi:hypothetical protein
MSTYDYRAVLGDGSGLAVGPLVSLSLVGMGAGLVLRRRVGDARPPGWRVTAEMARQSTEVLGVASGLEFLAIKEAELCRVAVALGHMSHIAGVVICPSGVDERLTALALAVGDTLRGQREGAPGVITCAVRPEVNGLARSLVAHEVLEDGGAVRVWEVVGTARLQ